MASSSDESKDNNNMKACNGIRWTNIRSFQHNYLVDIPHKSTTCLPINIELPSPLFDPIPITHYDEYKEVLRSKPRLDTRLAYYKKLYAKTSKPMYRQMIQENEFTTLPQYVVDVAQGAFQDCEDCTWNYTGGTLDLLSFNDDDFLVKTGFKQAVQVTNINVPSVNINIKLEKNPVYNIKSLVRGDSAVLAIRQKCKISLFDLSANSLETNLLWKVKTASSSFIDVVFNDSKENEFAVIDANHQLKIQDFVTKDCIAKYDFEVRSSNLDHFAQIKYIDGNTIGFINRCCIYLLDLRSLTICKSCLKTTWLKCDDLCTFSKNLDSLYISSLHNIINYDIRSLKVVDRVFHMLPTPPFISSYIKDAETDFVCLSGEHYNDKILSYSCEGLFSTPHYIPNTKDTFIKTSLTKRIDISEPLEERMSLPTIGMKLHKNRDSADIVLYTVNLVGDVFKQKITKTRSNNTKVQNKFLKWSRKIPYEPKLLEATSICNLGNVMHSISYRFPQEKKLQNLMKENPMQQLFEEEYSKLVKYFEGTVGESMNAIWDDQKPLVEENTNTTSESSKHKVSEWLDSVP